MKNKNIQRLKRMTRIRKKIYLDKIKPRLTVFRSNRFIYAQIINDKSGKTIASASDKDLVQDKTNKLKKIEKAHQVGIFLAEKMKKNNTKVKFDRGCYKYHGRVKALAEGARKGGLIF